MPTPKELQRSIDLSKELTAEIARAREGWDEGSDFLEKQNRHYRNIVDSAKKAVKTGKLGVNNYNRTVTLVKNIKQNECKNKI